MRWKLLTREVLSERAVASFGETERHHNPALREDKMNRSQWASLLSVLSLAWAVMPPLTYSQTSETKRWAIRIRGMVQRVQLDPYFIILEVKNHQIPIVRRQVLADEEQAPLGYITADIMGRTPGIEVRGPEDLLEALLQEKPSQRVLELRGVYDLDSRVFHLSALRPLDMYSPYPGCPPLPAQGPAKMVSVYATEAMDRPGIVCVRVINGLDKAIYGGMVLGRLQQWEEGRWWRQGRFRDYQDFSTLPDGSVVMVPSVLRGLPTGEPSDELLPLSGHPPPPGRYRVCASYQDQVSRHGGSSKHEVCSEEFSLP
jgi:hypothetical protein